MLDIFKKDPPLNYIYTPYKPKINVELINVEVIDPLINQNSVNAILCKDILVDNDK